MAWNSCVCVSIHRHTIQSYQQNVLITNTHTEGIVAAKMVQEGGGRGGGNPAMNNYGGVKDCTEITLNIVSSGVGGDQGVQMPPSVPS